MSMLRKISHSILPIILRIANNIIRTKVFPDILKISRIIPIPKSNDYMQPKNFRPINILSPITKIITKIWYIQMMDYLTAMNIIHTNHQGGIKGRSTTITALKIHQRLIEIMDKKKVGALIALDQSACFDVINHKIIIKKIIHIGFDENTIEIMTNFMKKQTENSVSL